MANKNFKVKNNVQVSDLVVAGAVTVDANGVLQSNSALPVAQGGTGQTTAQNAINALVPSQTSNANKLLGTDGTSVSWVSPGIAYQTSAPLNPVTGQLWVDSDETGDSLDPYIIRRKTITATAGQTVFTTDVTFTDGYEQVYYNGVLLVRTTDYTTSGGTNTVTLLQGASAGDTIEIIASTPINLINTLTSNSANTITAQTASSIPLTIQGAASQTANLFEVKNNAGEIRHQMSALGAYISRGNAADGSAIIAERYDNSDPVAVVALRGYGGTVSAPASVSDGVRVGLVSGEGWDGTAIRSVARITFNIDGPVSTGVTPGRITFNTVPLTGGGHIERMRITSSGNVGIGTNSPAQRLSVAGNINMAGGDSTTISWASDQSSHYIKFTNALNGITLNGYSNITFETLGQNERMRIHSDGNISIGTTVNNGKLLISSGNPTTELNIRAYDDASKMATIQADNNVLRLFARWTGGTGGLIAFHTGQPVTQRMMINANGNVGVGWSPDNNWHLSVNSNGIAGAGAFLSTSGDNILAGLFENSNASFTNNLVKGQVFRANNTGFIYYSAISSVTGTADTDWYVRGDGAVFSDSSSSMSTPADYAEYFEWADGNPNNEDRAGYSVSLINGTQIKIAEEGEEVIGIVSANPAVVGDSAWNNWTGKYQKDEFNRYIRDENGDRILSESFNSESTYIPREKRPEWSPVGMVGKLRMRKGQLVDSRWIKMRDISAEVEEWLVR